MLTLVQNGFNPSGVELGIFRENNVDTMSADAQGSDVLSLKGS